jgi:hypothetical protein
MRHEGKSTKPIKGRPLATDPSTPSSSPTEPAFIAPPKGASAYYGFPALRDVAVGGFTFGKITDFEAEPCDEGDAFVIAPDNSRAGLVWNVSKKIYFHEVMRFELDRWGVYEVSFPYPMTTRDNARKNLKFILPKLKQKWEEWRNSSKTSIN